MSQTHSESEIPPPLDLKNRWAELRTRNPKLRRRDAARQLGVSEAELVATGCGETAVRLTGDWGELLTLLPTLNTVLALTRNEQVVIEKTGVYQTIEIYPSHGMGAVIGEEIDLRLFLSYWHYGFALTEATASGRRRSLQFFDQDGSAVHKIYLTEHSNIDAYSSLVARFASGDQTPAQTVQPPAPLPAEQPDEAIDVAGFRAAWRAMQNTHELFALLKKFRLQRLQALRLAGSDWAYRVDHNAHRTALETARAVGLPIMVFVGNPGVIQIHTGPVRRLAVRDNWFNVLDPGFNLHLREDGVACAWVVIKPTADGPVTALELYDQDGQQLVQFFGKRQPNQHEPDAWRQIVHELPRVED